MDYLEKQNQLLARLRNMDELSRFDYLMHLAASQPEGDDELRRDENLFKACQSNLWIEILDKEGGLCIHADSDAMVVRAFLVLLLSALSNLTREEIADSRLDFWNDGCFDELLDQRTRQGLTALAQHIRSKACGKTQAGVSAVQ